MKKVIFGLVALLIATLPTSAQNYKDSRYYNQRTGHLDYGKRNGWNGDRGFSRNDNYFGFRIGPAFSYVNSDDSRLDGGKWQTGLNVGVVAGILLTDLTYDIGLANICHDTFDTSHNGALMLNVGVNF